MDKQRKNLLKLQKSLYKYMKNKALSLEGNQSAELKKYQKAQKKLSSRPFELVSTKKLTDRLRKSQVIYLGDFHSFDQSGRNMERIFRTLGQKGKNLALGVEFVHHKDQQFIDAFLDRHITELEFLEAINYHESWRFPWPHYKKFFDLARQNHLKILALNSQGRLEQRDRFAARVIADYLNQNKDHTLLVFFGELHIVPDKLPQRVRELKKGVNEVIIHQNLDEIFWKLQEQSTQNDLQLDPSKEQIIRFNEEEFCLQTSPPWIKYESMIYWFEHLVEDPEFEIHEYLMESGLEFNSTVPDTFCYLLEKIAEALELSFTRDELEHFNLYDYNKLEIVEEKLEPLPETLNSFFHKLIMRGRPFKIPGRMDYYCSSYSANRIAFLAGIHLQALCMEKNGVDMDALLEQGQWGRLCYFLKQMTVAYFTSKLMNPYRKCDHYEDLVKLSETQGQKRLKYRDPQILKLAAEILESSEHADMENFLESKIKGLDATTLYSATRFAGYALGDLLYEKHYQSHQESFREVFALLSNHHDSTKDTITLMQTILSKEDGVKGLKKRQF